MDHWDAVTLEQRARTDAGELQELRRVERSGAKQNLPRLENSLPALHSYRPFPLKKNARDKSIHFDGQVRPLLRRPQVGGRGARAPAAERRRTVVAGAFL